MQLSLKLAALGIILLLPKTELYLSNSDRSEAQAPVERAVSGSVAHLNVNSTSCPRVSVEGKQAGECSISAAKHGQEPGDTAAIHAMDGSPKGS